MLSERRQLIDIACKVYHSLLYFVSIDFKLFLDEKDMSLVLLCLESNGVKVFLEHWWELENV